jgi:hypothetical protein
MFDLVLQRIPLCPPQMTFPVTNATIKALLPILFSNILYFLSEFFIFIEIKAPSIPILSWPYNIYFYLQSAGKNKNASC